MSSKKKTLFTFIFSLTVLCLFSSPSFSGTDPFTIEFEQVTLMNVPTLQSFAYAQSGGKWLLLAGRTNGLHSFTTSPSFPPKYQNRTMYVYDPVAGQMWSRSTYQDLPLPLADRLSSSNTNYVQVGNRLYVIGGYGLDSTADSITTFSNITAIDVQQTINAIINNQSVAPYVRTLQDSRLVCTGGDLGYKNGYFYLYGGQGFYGDYLSPFSVQEYNYTYSKFQVNDNGVSLSISNFTSTLDSANLRRRDLNFLDAVYPDGTPYFINYGAVFTLATLPWLNPIYLDDTGYTVDQSFDQLFQQYDCASLVMMDSTSGDLYTTLFGGISYYYYDTVINQVVQDSNVPFVHDVSTIIKPASGTTTQILNPIRMPDLIGAEARLIPDTTVPHYENGVIKFHELTGRTFVGYIYGGIKADTSNFGTGSTASDIVLKVYVTPKSIGIQNISGEVPAGYDLSQNYPNPFNPSTKIRFSLPKSNFVKMNIYNALGQRVSQMLNRALDPGTYEVNWHAHEFAAGVYFYTIEAGDFVQTRKMVLVK